MRLAAITGKLPDELEEALGAERLERWLLINGKMRDYSARVIQESWEAIAQAKDPAAYQFVVARLLGLVVTWPF